MMDEKESQPSNADRDSGVVRPILHIAALASFAVAQPIYDLLARNAEFFVAHKAQPLDLVLLAGLVSLAPPALFVFPYVFARLFGRRVALWILWVTLGLLGSLATMPVIRRAVAAPGGVVLGLALTMGVSFALAYRRWPAIRSYLTFLTPAILVFPVLFLFFSPVRSLLLPQSETTGEYARVDSSTPVVLVVFDEFPLLSLLDPEGELDSRRYANFSALAADSYWFKNAVTAARDTTYAVPAILTGRLPDRQRLPTFDDYPQNLFSLLGYGGYSLRVMEAFTNLCPQDLCSAQGIGPSRPERMASMIADLRWVYLHILLPEDLASGLPAVTGGWRDFRGSPEVASSGSDSRAQRSDAKWLSGQFLDWLRAGEDATLYYAHLNLPHLPWKYLPSGRTYGPVGASIYPHGLQDNRWTGSPWEVAQGLQRHLLQAGFADRIVGQLQESLQEAGIYDRALIILVSDHGAGFRAGQERRGSTSENLADIANVPLLVKLPGQRQGVVDDRLVQTTDILPSLAGVLDIEVPWETSGRSLFDSNLAPRTSALTFETNRKEFGGPVRTTLPQLETARGEVLRFREDLFVDGDPWRFARHSSLLGRQAAELQTGALFRGRLAVDQTWQFDDVDPEGEFIPAHITGEISTDGPGRELAVAVNGTVRAVTETFLDPAGTERFTAMVPEHSFSTGRNEIEVLLIEQDGDLVRLRPVSLGESQDFALELDSSGEILRSAAGVRYPIPSRMARGQARIHSTFMRSFVTVATLDTMGQAPLERVLLFVDGRYVSSRDREETLPPFDGQRPDRVRFRMSLPDWVLSADIEVRVFALTAQQAREIKVRR